MFRLSTPSNGVLLVEMHRPPINAFHEPFWRKLREIFEAASKDNSVQVVVLASALPKVFTAGLDLKSSASILTGDTSDPSRRALVLRDHILDFQNSVSSIERCAKPVIAAAHGVCYGLAVDILCAADIRYAATSSQFSIKEVDVGLAADIGTLSRMPKIIGSASALREWALTGQNFSAGEALRVGFVSKVIEGGRDEVIAAALETAKTIASKSPIAVLGTKHLLLHAQDNTVQASLDYTATWNQVMIQSEDLSKAIQATLSKTQPKFEALAKL